MRLTIAILFVLYKLISLGQVTENFSDNDFTNNPVWSGDAAKFTIENEELRSNSNVVSDIFYISTPSTLAQGDLEWRFRVNMKFNTSGANYTDVFLMADKADLTSVTNGYFVRMGDTKDDVSLYKVVGGTETKLTDGTDSKTHNKNINIKVTKSAFGTWEVKADYTGGTNYTLEGTVQDIDITTSTHFGFYIKQSSASFHTKHFYDDIYVGRMVADTEAPEVIGQVATDANTIKIDFNETPVAFNTSDILVPTIGNPTSITPIGSSISIQLPSAMTDGSYTVDIDNIADAVGNNRDTIITIIYSDNVPQAGEVFITEIFADPSPSIGLPGLEFVELYNAGNTSIDLTNSTLSDASSTATIPSVVIPPKGYLILGKTGNESDFASYGTYLGVPSFPSLNNGADDVILRSKNGITIDSISYTDDWYGNDVATAGGYSLERIELSSSCMDSENWIASTAIIGGTPGSANSNNGVNPDSESPNLTSASIADVSSIVLAFSESLSRESTTNFELEEFGENPTSVSKAAGSNLYTLTFSSTLENSSIYHLNISNIQDCKGNIAASNRVRLANPTSSIKGDIIINELLFNPKDKGVDFVELYNHSEKILDLSELVIGRFTDERSDLKTISSFPILLFPEGYIVLTSDTIQTKKDYPKAKNLLQVNALPTMSNDEGIVLLLGANQQLLDSVSYSEDQHFALLRDLNGVSLERINFEGKGFNPSKWHSSSKSAGYATPGYQNSQFIDVTPTKSTFELQSKTISPDGDGYEDFLSLNYTFDTNGFVINGYVFNLAGRNVVHAFNNETTGVDGQLTWDGILDNGTKIPIGNYILLIESFDLNGKVIKKKLAFSVVSPF